MASIITATVSSGLTQQADNSGVLQLASGSGNLVTVPSVTGTAMVSGNMPAFAARRTTNQSLTSATYTKVQLTTEDFDTANCFDNSTNYRFTPNVAGYYQINLSISLEPTSGSGTIFLGLIYKNGSEFFRAYDSRASAILNASSGSILMYFNGTTDYIELYAYIQGTTPVITVAYLNGCLARAA